MKINLIEKLTSFKFLSVKSPFIHAILFITVIIPTNVNANRFEAPQINNAVADFDRRIQSDVFNVDFLLAHIRNTARKTVRETGELVRNANDIFRDTAIYTNNVENTDTTSTGNGGASAGSVIIPVGTTADTIIIINEVQGDSIAIQR